MFFTSYINWGRTLKLSFITLLFLFMAPNFAYANEEIKEKVYDGRTGKDEFIIKILEYKQHNGKILRAGKYFYKNQRIEYSLISQNGKLDFKEVGAACNEIEANNCPAIADFNIKINDNKLTGSRLNNKQSASNFNADYIGSYSLKLDDYKPKTSSDLLEFDDGQDNDTINNIYTQKLFASNLSYSKENFINGFGYKIVTHDVTGAHYPIITSAPPSVNLGKINEMLNKRRNFIVNEAFGCREHIIKYQSGEGFGNWDKYQANIAYIDSNIIVLQETGSIYCGGIAQRPGGSHANNIFSYDIFNMKTGQSINEEELFNIIDNLSEYSKYYNKISQDPKYLYDKNKPISATCQMDNLSAKMHFHPIESGIVFSLQNLPFVVSSCQGDYFTVPYKEMEPFMTPYAKSIFSSKLAK